MRLVGLQMAVTCVYFIYSPIPMCDQGVGLIFYHHIQHFYSQLLIPIVSTSFLSPGHGSLQVVAFADDVHSGVFHSSPAGLLGAETAH